MSGPIIRRYGFPNFEKIFGDRPLEHGVEESEKPETTATTTGQSAPKPDGTGARQDSQSAKPDPS